MAADPGGRAADRSESAIGDSIVEGATKVLVALFTAVSTIGFVVFAGAVLTWLRFYAAELPADQAIGHVPREELIATGATALFLFAIAGVLAVAAVYAIDQGGMPTIEMRRGLVVLVLAGMLTAIWTSAADDDRRLLASATACIVPVLAFWTTFRYRVEEGRPQRPDDKLRRKLFDPDLVEIPPSPAELQQQKARHFVAPRAFGPFPRRRYILKPSALALVLLAVALGLTATCVGLLLDEWYAAVACAAAAVLAGIAYGIAAATERFWPYGLAVFFAVALFGLVLTGVRSLDAPRAIPVALLVRGSDTGLVGLYVSDDDGIWFATVAPKCGDERPPTIDDTNVAANSGRLFHVPDREILDYATGHMIGVAAAAEEAPRLLAELSAMQAPARDAPPAGSVRRPPAGEPPPALRHDTDCTPPAIQDVAPEEPERTDRVVLVGRHLGRRGTLMLGDMRVRDISYWDPQRIVFRLGRDAPGDAELVVHRWGGTETGKAAVSVSAPHPLPVAGETAAERPAPKIAVSGSPVRQVVEATDLFAFDSIRLRPASEAALLQRRDALLRDARTLYVFGHTGEAGPAAHNRRLSLRQARRVLDVLLSDLDRWPRTVRARGLGESRPWVANGSAPGDRIRIVVLRDRRSD